MKRRVLLGGDFGTNGFKLLAYDAQKGCELASSYQPYKLYVPAANCAEHDPNDWWEALRASIAQVKRKGGFEANEIAAISLSCHVPTVLAIDDQGNELCRGMIWADNRAEEYAVGINSKMGDFLDGVNPSGVRAYHYVSKMSWLVDNWPDIYRKTKVFLQCNGYVVFRLTGKYSIDYSIAAGIHYYNVFEYRWDEQACEKLGVDIGKLPPVYACDEVVGAVLPSVAQSIGLDEGVLVVAGAADSSAAPLGVGCVEEGDICYSAGTGASMVSVYDCEKRRYNTDKRLITLGSTLPKRILNIAVMAGTGGSLKWMRDALCQDESIVAARLDKDVYDIMCEEAALSQATANGLLFLPYALAELAPFYNPSARGVFFGISDNTNKRDMLRAVIEGTCYAFRQNLKILQNVGGFGSGGIKEITATGGPAKSEFWMQTLADISGYRIALLENTLGAPFGDVILAGVGAGLFRDQISVSKDNVKKTRIFTPNDAEKARYDKAFEVYDEISVMLQESFTKLSAVRR